MSTLPASRDFHGNYVNRCTLAGFDSNYVLEVCLVSKNREFSTITTSLNVPSPIGLSATSRIIIYNMQGKHFCPLICTPVFKMVLTIGSL